MGLAFIIVPEPWCRTSGRPVRPVRPVLILLEHYPCPVRPEALFRFGWQSTSGPVVVRPGSVKPDIRCPGRPGTNIPLTGIQSGPVRVPKSTLGSSGRTRRMTSPDRLRQPWKLRADIRYPWYPPFAGKLRSRCTTPFAHIADISLNVCRLNVSTLTRDETLHPFMTRFDEDADDFSQSTYDFATHASRVVNARRDASFVVTILRCMRRV